MSGNYQSRVFTFISQRTDRLKDTCAKGLRHLKVAVVWTGQILLYPLQLLAQKLENFQPQLAPPPPQKSLPQPASDINIEQALESIVEAGYPIEIAASAALTVDDWSVIDDNIWNHGRDLIANQSQEATYYTRTSSEVRSPKPIIRGLSSLLSDRQLVLVTTENELLDLLTLTQQQQIRRQIGLDIAIAWHQWRASKIPAARSAPQIRSNDRALFDGKNTDLGMAIAGDNPANQTLFLQGEIDLTEPESPPPTLRDRLQNWWQKIANNQPESTPDTPKPQLQLPSTPYSFAPQPPRINRFVDLPQLPPIVESKPTSSLERPVLDTFAKLQPNWLKNWFSYYRDYLYIPSKQDTEIVHQPSEFQLIPIEPEPQKVKYTEITKRQTTSLGARARTPDRPTSIVPQKISIDLQHIPDWIEADAEPIGYSRSPLARFLEWLDRIVLSIENWLIKIWELITNNPANN